MTRAVLLVAVAALLVGACDGDEAATPPSSTPTTSVSSTEDAPTPSTISVTSTSPPVSSAETQATTPPATTADPDPSNPDDAETLGPLGETEVDIETDAGSVQIGSGTVPPAAAAVPVPDDLEVQLASEADGSAGFSGTSADSVEELAAFYRTELPAAGFEIVEDQEAGTAVFIVFARPGEIGQVAISSDPSGEGTTLIVAFGPA